MSSVKYQKIPSEDFGGVVDEYSPDFTVDEQKYTSSQDYSSIYSYNRADQFKSYFTYGFSPTNFKDTDNLTTDDSNNVGKGSSFWKLVAETGLITLCYAFVVFTMPFSLIFTLKFINQFERLVVFRLGRVQKPKGPGAVIVLPCIDSSKKVDMRVKAFNVPPLQAVTKDNGAVELGAVVYYCVKDALTCVSSVQDFSKVIRALGHSTLHKILNKKNFGEVEKDRKFLAEDLKGQLNCLLLTWGMEVTSVELSDVKVLRQPEPAANGVMRLLCQPQVASGIWKSLTQGAMITVDNLMQNEQQKQQPEINLLSDIPLENEQQNGFNLPSFVSTLNSVCSEQLVEDVGHAYQIVCPGLGEFFLDLKSGVGAAAIGRLPDHRIDASIELSASDLIELLSGRLSPLNAYMSNRIVVTGDTQAAMKLKVLSQYMQNLA